MDDEDAVSSFETPAMMKKEDGYERSFHSMGKAKTANSKEKGIPRYLRASTGSCHDLCKYGKREISVEKPWRSTTRKIFKKALDDDLNGTMKPGTSRTKKVKEAKERSVTDDSSEIMKREVVKCQVSGVSNGLKKQEALLIPSGDDETPVKQKQMKKKMTLISKPKRSPDSGSRSVVSLKPKVLTKSYSALTTSKSKINHEQVGSSQVLKPKMGKKTGGKDEDAKVNKAIDSSRVAVKKIRVTPKASLSPRLSVRLAGNSSLRKSQSLKAASFSATWPIHKPRHVKQKQLDGYPVEEKTLHVVEMEIVDKVSEHDQIQQCGVELFPLHSPTQSAQKYDEFIVSETEGYEYPSVSNEAESEEDEIEKFSGEKKPRAGNEGDSPDEAARELHFRRGKVVDADTTGESARRLKFRKGRRLEEDKAQDAQNMRSFKKREGIKEEEEEEEEDDDDDEKVVLRHQDVQEKDAQGLFNNVIEETASKLVEARKSKVKALVGAFETVISLQESKPPANSETGNLD